jgi:hypothetical protein
VLAKASAGALGLGLNELCRKYVELQRQLKSGTVEQAVDFFSDHGQRVQHGVANKIIYDEYLGHLEERGAGDYHVRDTRRYVGDFVAAFSGPIGPIQTSQIHHYLGKRAGGERERRRARPRRCSFSLRGLLRPEEAKAACRGGLG